MYSPWKLACQEFGDNFLLVDDAETFVISILTGEPDVGRHPPGAGLGRHGLSGAAALQLDQVIQQKAVQRRAIRGKDKRDGSRLAAGGRLAPFLMAVPPYVLMIKTAYAYGRAEMFDNPAEVCYARFIQKVIDLLL